jgi:hypothetical protein
MLQGYPKELRFLNLLQDLFGEAMLIISSLKQHALSPALVVLQEQVNLRLLVPILFCRMLLFLLELLSPCTKLTTETHVSYAVFGL